MEAFSVDAVVIPIPPIGAVGDQRLLPQPRTPAVAIAEGDVRPIPIGPVVAAGIVAAIFVAILLAGVLFA